MHRSYTQWINTWYVRAFVRMGSLRHPTINFVCRRCAITGGCALCPNWRMLYTLHVRCAIVVSCVSICCSEHSRRMCEDRPSVCVCVYVCMCVCVYVCMSYTHTRRPSPPRASYRVPTCSSCRGWPRAEEINTHTHIHSRLRARVRASTRERAV